MVSSPLRSVMPPCFRMVTGRPPVKTMRPEIGPSAFLAIGTPLIWSDDVVGLSDRTGKPLARAAWRDLDRLIVTEAVDVAFGGAEVAPHRHEHWFEAALPADQPGAVRHVVDGSLGQRGINAERDVVFGLLQSSVVFFLFEVEVDARAVQNPSEPRAVALAGDDDERRLKACTVVGKVGRQPDLLGLRKVIVGWPVAIILRGSSVGSDPLIVSLLLGPDEVLDLVVPLHADRD
jgi:hypothetical protein